MPRIRLNPRGSSDAAECAWAAGQAGRRCAILTVGAAHEVLVDQIPAQCCTVRVDSLEEFVDHWLRVADARLEDLSNFGE